MKKLSIITTALFAITLTACDKNEAAQQASTTAKPSQNITSDNPGTARKDAPQMRFKGGAKPLPNPKDHPDWKL